MADTKLTGLTQNTSPATTDYVLMTDDPSGTALSQYITYANFLKVVDQLTAITSGIAATDTALILDGGTAKKVTIPNLIAGVDRHWQGTVVNYTIDCTTGDGKAYIHIPPDLNGMNLTYCHAENITAGTTGTMDIQIHNLTQTADMLSTVITIDTTETGSDTAATPYAIDAAEDDVATNDFLRIDVDAVHTTEAKGLVMTLGFGL